MAITVILGKSKQQKDRFKIYESMIMKVNMVKLSNIISTFQHCRFHFPRQYCFLTFQYRSFLACHLSYFQYQYWFWFCHIVLLNKTIISVVSLSWFNKLNTYCGNVSKVKGKPKNSPYLLNTTKYWRFSCIIYLVIVSPNWPIFYPYNLHMTHICRSLSICYLIHLRN